MKQENLAFADIELCDEAVSVASEPAEVDIIDLQVTKTADCQYAVVGGKICYTVTIFNNSDVNFVGDREDDEMGGVIFRDPLTSNLEYIPGTFTYTIDCGEPDPTPVQVEPNIDTDNVMTYDSLEIPAGCTAIVKFCVKVKSAPETPPTP